MRNQSLSAGIERFGSSIQAAKSIMFAFYKVLEGNKMIKLISMAKQLLIYRGQMHIFHTPLKT